MDEDKVDPYESIPAKKFSFDENIGGGPLELEDLFPFGKYKGTSLQHLIKQDVGYITWVIENNKNIQLSEEVLEHAQNLLDRVRIYEVRIQSLVGQNRLSDAVQVALPVLENLGIRIPRKSNALKF